MTRIWGSGLSFLFHASIVATLGLGLEFAPEEAPAVSVAPSVPTQMSTRVIAEGPRFDTPLLRSACLLLPSEGSIAYVPDHVETEMEFPVPLTERIMRESVVDRAVAPSSLRVSEPAPKVTAPPSEIRNPPPRYPRLARRRNLEGMVVVEITVRKDGTCGAIRVVEQVGSSLFVQSVMDALQGWLFRPATRGGVAIEVAHQVKFHFRLQE